MMWPWLLLPLEGAGCSQCSTWLPDIQGTRHSSEDGKELSPPPTWGVFKLIKNDKKG